MAMIFSLVGGACGSGCIAAFVVRVACVSLWSSASSSVFGSSSVFVE